MKSISIFGLGYVGTVTAACFASRGHRVIGVDTNPQKVERVQQGASPIVEAGIDEMIAEAHRAGLLTATCDAVQALANSDISFVSVGTPSQRNGKLDLSHIRDVCTDIGTALATKDSFHWIVLRSTVLPGTTEEIVLPAIEAASGKTAGKDFMLSFNPEFLREGTAVADFFDPPFTIIGSNGQSENPIAQLYDFVSAPLYSVSIAEAEMVKYSCNTFHALKIAFANEIGTLCSTMGLNPKTIADIFKSDRRLNISTAYLNPGFAFGGSCLPKDLRALTYKAKELDLKLPLLESILPSNVEHIERNAEKILSLSKRKIGVLGLSFKAGTDDLRESPMVYLVKKLIAEGCDIQIWDDKVSLGQLIGSNRQFIQAYIPHIGTLLRGNVDDVLAHAEVLVLGSSAFSRDELMKRLSENVSMIDLTTIERLPENAQVAAAPLYKAVAV